MMFLSAAEVPAEMTAGCEAACAATVKKERGFAMWKGVLLGAFASSVVWYMKSR